MLSGVHFSIFCGLLAKRQRIEDPERFFGVHVEQDSDVGAFDVGKMLGLVKDLAEVRVRPRLLCARRRRGELAS